MEINISFDDSSEGLDLKLSLLEEVGSKRVCDPMEDVGFFHKRLREENEVSGNGDAEETAIGIEMAARVEDIVNGEFGV